MTATALSQPIRQPPPGGPPTDTVSAAADDPPPHKKWLTVKEAARVAGSVSKSLIYEMVKSGRLPAVRVGQGRGTIRVRMEDAELLRTPVEPPPAAGGELRHIKLK